MNPAKGGGEVDIRHMADNETLVLLTKLFIYGILSFM